MLKCARLTNIVQYLKTIKKIKTINFAILPLVLYRAIKIV